MALTNEEFFELRRLLDALHREPEAYVEVSIIEGQGPTVKIGPTSYASAIVDFEDLPGVRRVSLKGASFGGWEAEYCLANDNILQGIKSYKSVGERERRVREAFRPASESKTPTIIGGAKSAMWIATSTAKKLQSPSAGSYTRQDAE